MHALAGTTVSVLLLACVAAGAQGFNAEPPNAAGQTPAFAGQTRAPVIKDTIRLRREVVADGLDQPWGMAELPDGRWLVTEKPGTMRIVSPDGDVSKPIGGIPGVDARGQGGLLDVAIRDDFASTRRVWWCYSEPRGKDKNGTSVATGVLSADNRTMENVRVVFRQKPAWHSTLQYGSRLVFDRKGALFVTLGDRSLPGVRKLAQDVSTDIGKVVRIKPMGGAAPGNPDISGGRPEIWSWGHRNPEGAALGPDGALWTVEHGPRGGDELNRPQSGRNYGWPVITYGEDYSGAPIGKGITRHKGMEQPVYYWDPVIAPSGLTFYEGSRFPAWKGSALIGGLASEALVRLAIEDGRVTGEARYFEGEDRIRDVVVARDGAVMLLTDSSDGKLIRVTPMR